MDLSSSRRWTALVNVSQLQKQQELHLCCSPTKPLPETWCSFILKHSSPARAFLESQWPPCVWSVFVSTTRHVWNVPCCCLITTALPVHALSKLASKTTAALCSRSSWEGPWARSPSLDQCSHGEVLHLHTVTHQTELSRWVYVYGFTLIRAFMPYNCLAFSRLCQLLSFQ